MSLQRELDRIKLEIRNRLYVLFMEKYNGNKLRFAKDVNCDEKTIRLLFDNNQGITINLLFKLANALEIEPAKIIEGLSINQNK